MPLIILETLHMLFLMLATSLTKQIINIPILQTETLRDEISV